MASQSKEKQPFRFWPWKIPTPRAREKTSSLKPQKMPPSTPFKSTPEVASKPPSKGPSLPISTSLSPSPLLAPSPTTRSPPTSRSTSDEVTRARERQTSPPTKLSPTSSPIPRYEDPTPMAKTSTTQLSLEAQQKVPSPRAFESVSPLPPPSSPTASPSRRRTDEVPQSSSPPSKVSPVASSSPGGSKREDPATSTEISPAPSQDAPQEVSQTPSTHQQEILPRESQTTQPPKQVEPEHLMETEPAPELRRTIETMIPTSRTFPNGSTKASMPTQVDGRNESDEQHVNGEATTKDLEVTKEEITAKTSKEGQTIEHPKIPQSESKEENKLVQRLNIESSWRHGGTEHGMHILTLAGENNGASMHIRRKALDKAGPRRGAKVEEHPSAESKEVPSISTSVNSNVQSINNSLLHQSSCSQEDPGVHLTISNKPAKSVDSKDEMEP